MDRKTKHRILGILVVIGLVIILLPLFQGRKEEHNDTALVTAPPFPDQSIQVASATGDQKSAIPTQEPGIPQTIVDSAPNANNMIGGIKQQPDDTINVVHPNSIHQENNVPMANNEAAKPTTAPLDNPAKSTVQLADNTNNNVKAVTPPASLAKPENTTPTPVAVQSDDSEAVNLNAASSPSHKAKTTHAVLITKTKPARSNSHKIIETKKNNQAVKTALTDAKYTTIKSHLAALKTPLDEDGLAKLKSAAWVIQIGSYKNKTNALRMVNQLRANGYNAFIQQISSSLGEHTRVFVGPEIKLNSARALVDRLQSEMHIQGIVISYKPLTL